MKEHFDLIAIPKGQVPGGPIQASDGSWYIVIPAVMEFTDVIERVKRHRAGHPVSSAEITKAIELLSQHSIELDEYVREDCLRLSDREQFYRSLGLVASATTMPREGSTVPEDATVWAGLIKTFAEMNESEVNTILAKGLDAGRLVEP